MTTKSARIGCGILIALAILAWYAASRYLNPYDRVRIDIAGLPADAKFACLLADELGKLQSMPWSYSKVFPFTMQPNDFRDNQDDIIWRGESTYRNDVLWIHSDQVGVLVKDALRNWTAFWFDKADISFQDRGLLFGGGRCTLDIRKAKKQEAYDDMRLRELGIKK